MKWVIAGLGNPDSHYIGTRHNIGRDFIHSLEKHLGKTAVLITPDLYMNNSGVAVKKAVSSIAAAKKLIVLHDEIDLPLGRVKISFGSSAGGHRGVDSIQKALKTKNFIRIRIGISPATPAGKIKKPDADDVPDFVLAKFKPAEQEKVKKVCKRVVNAIDLILNEGLERAMTEINSKA